MINKVILSLILAYIICFCSCSQNHTPIKIQSDSKVLKDFFESSQFYRIKRGIGVKSDTLYLLKNKFTNDVKYSWKDFSKKEADGLVLVESEDYLLDNLFLNYLFVQKIIENNDLARIDMTYKQSTGIQVSLEKLSNGTWGISHYNVKDNYRLKDQEGTLLFREIQRQIKLKELDSL